MREPSDHATAPQRRDAAQLTARHALLSSVLRHRLRLEGLLSVTSLAAVRAGLPIAWPDTARVLFATFADEDVPVGARFDRVLREGHGDAAEATPATLIAVTQQWARPFEVVPRGWKSICLVDFPAGVPAMIAHLPTVDAWHEAPSSLALCSTAEEASGGDAA